MSATLPGEDILPICRFAKTLEIEANNSKRTKQENLTLPSYLHYHRYIDFSPLETLYWPIINRSLF